MLRLAEVVKDLRSELYEAIDAAATEPLQFELGDIELELAVGVTKEGGTGGKVRFWVVELGAEGKVGTTSTQTLKLKLSPRIAATGKTPVIAGAPLEGEGTGP